MEKRVLGRGLSALIPEKESGAGLEQKETIVYIPIGRIKPNPFQPREDFDQENLRELTSSIKEKGIIQPVLVRAVAEGYELIAGERRLRAAKSLQINVIPAIVKEAQDEESLEIALIENIQRQDLSPIEEAYAYKHLMDKFAFTQEKIAQTIGKARATVTNTLRLLKLPMEVQDLMRKKLLSFAHGKVLLEIQEGNKQIILAHQAVKKGLSVKALEALILPGRTLRKGRPKQEKESRYEHISEELQQILGTRVKVISAGKCSALYIEFYSQDDLHRIYEVIKR